MALKYVLKAAKAPMGSHKGKLVYVAIPAPREEVSFRSVCDRVAEQSAMTSADIKAVLDRIVHILQTELPDGKVVRLGELGSFHLSFGSPQVLKEEDFDPSMIRAHRVVYRPSIEVREISARGQLAIGSSTKAFSYVRTNAQPRKEKKKNQPVSEDQG